MKDLFESRSYVDFLSKLCRSKRGTQARLAKAMACQPAYLSQVMKGKAGLTEDHAVKLAFFLQLSKPAIAYFILLVRLGRAGTPELRNYLENERQRILIEQEDLRNRVDSKTVSPSAEIAQVYTSSWIHSTLHIATSCPRYQTPEQLASRFGVNVTKVKEVLRFLMATGLVHAEAGKYVFSGESIHFPHESSSNQANQVNRRMQAIRSIQENNVANLHFSSIFTTDRSTAVKLKEDTLRFIEQSQKKIHASGTEEVFSICADLFEVV